jgi:hypothetical protein
MANIQSYLLTPTLLLAAFGGGYATSLATQGATLRAAVPQTIEQKFTGRLGSSIQTAIETCVGDRIIAHANNALGLSGENAVDQDDIGSACFWWTRDEQDNRKIDWRYSLKPLQGSWTPGTPQ